MNGICDNFKTEKVLIPGKKINQDRMKHGDEYLTWYWCDKPGATFSFKKAKEGVPHLKCNGDDTSEGCFLNKQ